MAQGVLNILIVDDDAGDRQIVTRALARAGLPCNCVETDSIGGAIEATANRAFDCAIIDYRMPGYDGLQGIAALLAQSPDTSIIMATGQGDEMVATEAMKRGAADYVPKSRIQAESIRRIIENALEKGALRRKVAQQREELENFARVLAHDLKAPICSIKGFADLMTLRIGEGGAEEIAGYSRQVGDAALRMNQLIDTLEEYTKADTQVEFEPLEMQHVLERTLANLGHLFQTRRARATHGPLPVVTGNDSQLIQLLQNLIGNGIKYCEADTPHIHVAASRHDHETWLFSVQDNGIGIPEQDYRTVFEPFKRLHDPDKYEGTGLGLATCRKIVERHGGVIRCESVAGEGTTFLFTLRGAAEHA